MPKQHANDLRLAGRVAAAVTMALVLAACARTARVEYPPAPGSYFTVPLSEGESISVIASRYQVREDDIVAINNIRDRDLRLPLKNIRVPAYGHLKDQRRQETGGARLRNAPVESRPLAPTKGKGAQPVADTTKTAKGVKGVKPQNTAANAPKKQPAAEAQWWNPFGLWQDEKSAPEGKSRSFDWPVKGRVLSSYGTGEGGARNDGINISARRGAPVRAADAGAVTYVGDALKGYGNLVLIKHDNGYVTAYAHSDTVKVSRGDKVTRGQIIAYAGATGNVSQPQVHFEVRLNTRPVDPARYLVASN